MTLSRKRCRGTVQKLKISRRCQQRTSLAANEHELAGLRQVCDQPATRFEQVRAISKCRDISNLLEPGRRPVCSWSKPIPLRYPDRRQVRGWSQTCRRPASSCSLAASELDDKPNSSSLQVCDQLRTCLRPDSVMEFGFLYGEML